jgi:hypothetical protein
MFLGALGFIFLSLDETGQLHERLGNASDVLLPGGSRRNTDLSRTGYWMFILAPAVLGTFWVWWRNISHYFVGFPGKGKVFTGTLVFVAGATIPEYASNFLVGSPLMLLLEISEELSEMAGITIFMWGFLELCSSHSVVVDFNFRSSSNKGSEKTSLGA